MTDESPEINAARQAWNAARDIFAPAPAPGYTPAHRELMIDHRSRFEQERDRYLDAHPASNSRCANCGLTQAEHILDGACLSFVPMKNTVTERRVERQEQDFYKEWVPDTVWLTVEDPGTASQIARSLIRLRESGYTVRVIERVIIPTTVLSEKEVSV